MQLCYARAALHCKASARHPLARSSFSGAGTCRGGRRPRPLRRRLCVVGPAPPNCGLRPGGCMGTRLPGSWNPDCPSQRRRLSVFACIFLVPHDTPSEVGWHQTCPYRCAHHQQCLSPQGRLRVDRHPYVTPTRTHLCPLPVRCSFTRMLPTCLGPRPLNGAITTAPAAAHPLQGDGRRSRCAVWGRLGRATNGDKRHEKATPPVPSKRARLPPATAGPVPTRATASAPSPARPSAPRTG
jgi:hypothetical protein